MGRSRVDASAIITPEPCGMHNVIPEMLFKSGQHVPVHNDFHTHLLIHRPMCSSFIRLM